MNCSYLMISFIKYTPINFNFVTENNFQRCLNETTNKINELMKSVQYVEEKLQGCKPVEGFAYGSRITYVDPDAKRRLQEIMESIKLIETDHNKFNKNQGNQYYLFAYDVPLAKVKLRIESLKKQYDLINNKLKEYS